MPLFRGKYSAPAAVFTACGAIACLLPGATPVWLHAGLFVLYVGGNGWCIGSAAMPQDGKGWQTFWGILLLLAATAGVGATIYLAASLGPAQRVLAIALAPWIAIAAGTIGRSDRSITLVPSREQEEEKESRLRKSGETGRWLISFAAALAAIGLAFAALSIAADFATDNALRSPWDAVPLQVIALFFLSAVAACASSLAGGFGATAWSALVGTSLSLAAVVYSIGYGFDPFIHRASEQAIMAHGAVLPKTVYYLGQYALVVIGSAGTGLPVAKVDLFLLPLLTAAAPAAAYWSLRRGHGHPRHAAALGSALTVLIPLSPFVATTPQGLADLFALLTAFAAIPAASGALPKGAFALLAAATAAIHPLAGIPVLVFAAIAFACDAKKDGKRSRRSLAVKIAVIGAFILPLVFVLNAAIGSAGVRIDWSSFRSPSDVIGELQRPQTFSRRYIGVYDFTYFWRDARAAAIVIAAGAGAYLLRKRGVGVAYALGALAIGADFALLSSVLRFPFLIDYERTNYADRLGDLALILLAAPAAVAVGALSRRVREYGFPALRVAFAVAIAGAATSSIYLAYPRHDKYDTSRGWSTSAQDVAAVRLISKDADGLPYVALANQSASAAAIREFGFSRYYEPKTGPAAGPKEPVFFYPVPTGGPLYAIYLGMNDANGDPKVARRAMDLVGVDIVYFIVDDYWWNAQRIVASAKKTADRWWSVDGKSYVFRYDRKK